MKLKSLICADETGSSRNACSEVLRHLSMFLNNLIHSTTMTVYVLIVFELHTEKIKLFAKCVLLTELTFAR